MVTNFKTKMCLLKCFWSIGAVVIFLGLVCEVGFLLAGMPPYEPLLCVILGGCIVKKSRDDQNDLIEQNECQGGQE